MGGGGGISVVPGVALTGNNRNTIVSDLACGSGNRIRIQNFLILVPGHNYTTHTFFVKKKCHISIEILLLYPKLIHHYCKCRFRQPKMVRMRKLKDLTRVRIRMDPKYSVKN